MISRNSTVWGHCFSMPGHIRSCCSERMPRRQRSSGTTVLGRNELDRSLVLGEIFLQLHSLVDEGLRAHGDVVSEGRCETREVPRAR